MPWLVDGSNVLGALPGALHSEEAKRQLMQRLASFARENRTRVTCCFDGVPPGNFARHLGGATAMFSGSRAADDCIAELAATGRWSVVTSDAALAARVRRRGVEIIPVREFLRRIEESESGRSAGEPEWERYFSDPKNRLKF
ncbi:MAG TPA: NYN domain-containing protein [Thermoanaerobaculia bacterium]|nr:NYN domain-containing protein [Thermoanaerobaculia bacterium]